MYKILFRNIIVISILLSCTINASTTILKFVGNNITIREAFYFENSISNKGTHKPGDHFLQSVKNNIKIIIYLQTNQIKNLYEKINKIDPKNTNFSKEYELVSLFYELSELPNFYKKQTALYIPKSIQTYWEMSCDTHMVPFISTAITNIAMINGLPDDNKESCFGHKLEYGYYNYYKKNKKFISNYMNHTELCKIANKNNFNRIIEIRKKNIDTFFSYIHECKK